MLIHFDHYQSAFSVMLFILMNQLTSIIFCFDVYCSPFIKDKDREVPRQNTQYPNDYSAYSHQERPRKPKDKHQHHMTRYEDQEPRPESTSKYSSPRPREEQPRFMARTHPPEQFETREEQDAGYSGYRPPSEPRSKHAESNSRYDPYRSKYSNSRQREEEPRFMAQTDPREQIETRQDQDAGYSGYQHPREAQDPGYDGYQHPYHANDRPGYDNSRYQDLGPTRPTGASVFTAGHTNQAYFPEDAASARMSR